MHIMAIWRLINIICVQCLKRKDLPPEIQKKVINFCPTINKYSPINAYLLEKLTPYCLISFNNVHFRTNVLNPTVRPEWKQRFT